MSAAERHLRAVEDGERPRHPRDPAVWRPGLAAARAAVAEARRSPRPTPPPVFVPSEPASVVLARLADEHPEVTERVQALGRVEAEARNDGRLALARAAAAERGRLDPPPGGGDSVNDVPSALPRRPDRCLDGDQ